MICCKLIYYFKICKGFKNDTKMPQTRLSFFPEDIELINTHIGVQKKNDIVYYFNGMMPVF